MSILVEGPTSVFLGAQAWLVEEDRELAWAEKHVVHNPAYKYVLGRYVEATQANENGHIFDLAELPAAQASLAYSPLNLLHHPHYIVGAFVASELVYPTAATAGMIEQPANPYVEALSAFWRYYFPEEFKEVEKAHNEGSLYYSMECVPETVKCAAVCQQEFAYDGRQSDTYCDHLNKPGGTKRLGKPHFMGGALIIPPTKPGWKGAGITEMSALLKTHADEAEAAYKDIKTTLPHLGERQWEAMVAEVLRLHADGTGNESLPNISKPEDVANAIRVYRLAKPGDKPKIKAHIIKNVKALGKSTLLPDGWDS